MLPVMDRKHAALAAGVLALLLATASLLAGLRHALRRERRHAPETPESRREEERRRLRAAMGDMLAPPIDFGRWPENLRPRPDLPDRDKLRRSLPKSTRPAWMDIREDRDSGW